MLKILTGFLASFFSSLTLAGNIPITFNETLTDAQGNQQQIQYTSYFVLDYFDDESGVLCRTFITFGEERLPLSEKKHYKKTAKNLFKNGEYVYAVAETYFYNYSTSPITIQPISFSWKGVLDESPFEIKNYHMNVDAQSQAITPSIVKQAFYLKKEFNIEFRLKINNNERLIKGVAKRMTKEDLQLMLKAAQ